MSLLPMFWPWVLLAYRYEEIDSDSETHGASMETIYLDILKAVLAVTYLTFELFLFSLLTRDIYEILISHIRLAR